MKSQTAGADFNIPARMKRWSDDGGAQVELLSPSPCGTYDMGSVLRVSLRPDSKGRLAPDFNQLRKRMLKLGGVVLLRKLITEPDGSGTIRSADILAERSEGGPFFFSQAAAICLLPPAPGKMLVTQALVALLKERVEMKSVKEGLDRISAGLEQAVALGKGGVMITGEDRAGDLVEVMVGGDEHLTVEEIVFSIESNLDPELVKEIKASKSKWYMVPFFRANTDPDQDRSSKMSAQRGNHEAYGNDETASWTLSNVMLRAYMNEWLVVDTAVISDEDQEPLPMIDLIENQL